MTNDPVILINPFEVPEGQDEQFLASWEQSRDFLRTQPGYLSTKLHRSLAPHADFRYVNVARWESAAAFRMATAQPQFRAQTPPYHFHAALYEVVREDT